MTDYAIIGAGFSGTALVAHLIQAAQIYRLQTPLRIFLIEKGAFAEGVAYSTQSNVHLLNIGAGFMSLFPSDKNHFLYWVQKKIPDCTSNTFVPRVYYKKYLKSILREAKKKATNQCLFEKITGEVISLSEESGKYLLELKDGLRLSVDKVVFAMGNYPPPNPPFISKNFLQSTRYLPNPWSKNSSISPLDTVFILGSGLTMIDKVLELEALQHVGKIHVISRHGFLPQVFKTDLDCTFFLRSDLFQKVPQKINFLLRILKEEIKKAISMRQDTDCIFQSFINHLVTRWHFLPVNEQDRFLRHLKTHFSVYGSRMPNESSVVIQRMLQSGQLYVHAGRVCSVQENGNKVDISFLPRSHNEQKTLKVNIVMNCLGPAVHFHEIEDAFLNDLVRKGFVRATSRHQVLDVSSDLAVINSEGNEATELFALGSLKKMPLGILPVPYIALEAQFLSQAILMEHVDVASKFQLANSNILLKHRLGMASLPESEITPSKCEMSIK